MYKVKIKVTEKHISDGIAAVNRCFRNDSGKNSGEHCAVAQAVRELFPNAYVTPEFIDLSSTSIPLGPVGQELVDKFDESVMHGGPVPAPTEFEIEVPSDVIESIGITEAFKILSESKSLELLEICPEG